MSSIVGRRVFLKTSAAAGTDLLLAFRLPAHERPRTSGPSSGTSFAPNAYLELCPDGQIRIWCARSEIGQGIRASLPMIVADELGCDWAHVTVVQGDLDARFGDQTTGGSYSVRGSYADLPKAGAAARAMLLSAAATEWRVPPSECRIENSFILHPPTQRKVTFENLLSAASSLQPPANPPLKEPSDFALIGRPTRRTDTMAKITGAAQFGIDTRISGMLVASVERCPVYGGMPRRFNADKSNPCPASARSSNSPRSTSPINSVKSPAQVAEISLALALRSSPIPLGPRCKRARPSMSSGPRPISRGNPLILCASN